jgi:sugar-specific transcriptional regulator TrmB
MIKELQTIGFTKNEAIIYEALVENGPCKAGLLINRLDIHRNLIYQSLEKLILKGFATKVIEGKIWRFQITDPNSLLSKVKQQESIFTEIIKTIQLHRNKSEQQIVVYEGLESYRNYWVESLERIPEGSTDYTVGAPTNTDWAELMGEKYQEYMDLRIKKKIYWKTIHFKITDSEKEMLRKYPKLTEYRLWSSDNDCMGNFNVIYDTVILHTVTDPVRIIEIRDSALVAVFKNYFDMMWEKSEPVSISKKLTPNF